MRDHGLATARRVIEAGLRREGLIAEELGALTRSDPRKASIAREVRAKTTVPLKWLAETLAMGTTMNVSRLTRRL